MSQRSFFGVLLDTCQHCAGIFFDEGEVCQIRERGGVRAFDELDSMIQPEPGHEDATGHDGRDCPACHQTMRRFRYLYSSPVVLDSCDGCGGIWIDNGELQQMREYMESAKDGRLTSKVQGDLSINLDTTAVLDRARAQRARIAASMIALHND